MNTPILVNPVSTRVFSSLLVQIQRSDISDE
jgi:hypothetical protein